MTTPEEGAAQVQAQLDEAEPELKRLREANDQEMMSIAQLGGIINPDSMLKIRLDVFIEFVFTRLGNATPEIQRLLAVMFETAYEEKMAESLNGVKGEIRKAMLGAGSAVPQGDIERMWKAQQTHRKNGDGRQPGTGGLIT